MPSNIPMMDFVGARHEVCARIARFGEKMRKETPEHDREADWQEQYDDVKILYEQAKNAITHRQLVDILLDRALEA